MEVRLDKWFSDLFPFRSRKGKALAGTRTGPGGEWKISFQPGPEDWERIFQVTALKAGYVPSRARVILREARKKYRISDLKLELGTQVWGRVLDERGRPVAGASVSAEGPGAFKSEPVVTDGKGRYAFPGFPDGTVGLTVDAKGFALAYKEIQIAPAAYPMEVDFLLTKGLSISGRVIDKQGNPVQGANIYLSRRRVVGDRSESWSNPGESARSGKDGRFRIGALEKGAVFRLGARADGFLPWPGKWVRAGTQGILVTLERGCAVKARVLDYQGKPAASAFLEAVLLSPRSGGIEKGRKIRAKRGNEIYCTGLEPGEWIFWGGMPSSLYAVPGVRKVLRKGETADLGTFRLPRPASLRITVLDGEGNPLAGVNVRAKFEWRTFRRRRKAGARGAPRRDSFEFPPFMMPLPGKTGKDGVFFLEGLSGGPWFVEARKPGFVPVQSGLLDLLPGDEKVVNLRLGKGGSILVRVFRKDGKPLKGACVHLEGPMNLLGNTRYSYTVLADKEGLCRKDKLRPGKYVVRLRRYWNMSGNPERGIMIRRWRGLFSPGTWKVLVEEGKVTELRIPSVPLWRIHGVLRDARGPVAGARVRIIPEKALYWEGLTAVTGPDGSYTLDDVDPGSLVLAWGRKGCAAESREKIELSEEGGEMEKDLVLPSGAIRGRVVDAAGRPLAGLFVLVWRKGEKPGISISVGYSSFSRRRSPRLPGKEVSRLRTDSEGRFLLKEIPAGSWTVGVKKKAEGRILASKKVKVSGGRTADAGTIPVNNS